MGWLQLVINNIMPLAITLVILGLLFTFIIPYVIEAWQLAHKLKETIKPSKPKVEEQEKIINVTPKMIKEAPK
jgi:hypothetical protein